MKKNEEKNKKANQPLVTVVTPTFNLIKGGRKETFIQSAESVQKQTYKNIEHIVIDGASKDGTLKLLEKYQKKGWFKYYSEPDKGLYDGINKGILKAKGKYVIVLNSDDFYCNDKAIEMLVQKAEEQDADACYGNAVVCDEKTDKYLYTWNGKDVFYPPFGSYPCHQTLLVKHNVMLELGLYDLEHIGASDNNFMLKMVCYGKKLFFCNENLVTFRTGGWSMHNKDKAYKDGIWGFYQEYGQYHGLTPLDCSYLFGYSYLNLPLEQAIALGSKLEKAEWREEYFKRLFNKYDLCGGAQHHNTQATKTMYKLFGFLPLLKTRKDSDAMKISLFGFLPLYGHKKVGGREQWKFLGLPIFKIRKMSNGITTKYYILGLPVMKVSKKICGK